MAENPRRTGRRGTVAFSEPADRDQTAIFADTAEQCGTEQAERYLDFLNEVMDRLATAPATAPKAPRLTGVRVYVARWKNARQGHRIFFEETDNGIYIVRILHTAMNWQKHFD